MGWTRKILRVDLTKSTCTSEPLNMKWAQDYLGQRGLATKYFVEETDPKVDPLAPANKLIMATGPLTGTPVSTGGRYSVITKGALTGAIACSNSGGYFGAEMKFAGWDMVIFEGKSTKPVYLAIEDDKAELRDAAHLWGKTVWQTEEIIKRTHQDPQTRVASIGRAGENGVLYACIVNDLHRAAGRSGVGTVMGSKNLKAVAVRGTKGGGGIKDARAFMQAVAAAKKVLADNAVTGQGLPKYGTQVLMNVINEIGALPTRNHRDVQFEDARKISAEAMHEKRPTDGKAQLVTNAACFGCTIACGRISRLDETHFSVVNKPQYWGASGGLEYEAAWALGAANGVGDLEALQYANLLCNEDGYDPISFGATVGAAMELYDLGILTREQIGLDAPFGSAQALVRLSEMTAKGEGFGKELGLGSARLCAKYGKPELSMGVVWTGEIGNTCAETWVTLRGLPGFAQAEAHEALVTEVDIVCTVFFWIGSKRNRQVKECLGRFEPLSLEANLSVPANLSDDVVRAVFDAWQLLGKGLWARTISFNGCRQAQRIVGAFLVVDLAPKIKCTLGVIEIGEAAAVEHFRFE